MSNYNRYDLAIAYRIYPKVSGEPPIFKDDKFKLSELCLKSLKDSLGSLRVKIWALLDKCPPEYETLFKKYFNQEDLEIINLNGIGNQATFRLQIEILIKQNISKYVYFAEDDYFYLPKEFESMVLFLKSNKDVDFVSPYDHIDYYIKSLHKYDVAIKVFRNKHWRETATTCCTFLTERNKLIKTKKTFLKYSAVNNFFVKYRILRNSFIYSYFLEFLFTPIDSDIWLSLTKKKVFNIFRIIRLRFQDRWLFGIYFKTWRFHWKQILFGKKYKLWTPIPTIATHMVTIGFAPAMDRNKIQKNADLLYGFNI